MWWSWFRRERREEPIRPLGAWEEGVEEDRPRVVNVARDLMRGSRCWVEVVFRLARDMPWMRDWE